MLWKRIAVRDQERFLVAKNSQFYTILTPGTHRVFTPPGVSVQTEKFNVSDFVFQSSWANYLVNNRPDVIEQHFIKVKTNNVQIGMVYANGNLFRVLTPGKVILFWRGVVNVTAEIVDIIANETFESDDLANDLGDLLENFLQAKVPAGV